MVHLIWTCRDADLVEFYLNQVQFDDDAWSFIFYPGKRNAPVMLSPLGPHTPTGRSPEAIDTIDREGTARGASTLLRDHYLDRYPCRYPSDTPRLLGLVRGLPLAPRPGPASPGPPGFAVVRLCPRL